MVRAPLGGRRVKGFVVEIAMREPTKLRDIAQVSGRSTVLTEELIQSLSWASHHYVAPFGPMLDRAAPPNVPPAAPAGTARYSPDARRDHPLSDIVTDAIERRRHRPIALLDATVETLARLVEDCRNSQVSLMVVAPTALEVTELAAEFSGRGNTPLTVTPDVADKDVTSIWRTVRHVPSFVIGTPRLASWAIQSPAIVVVISESRRAMKDRQSPTVAVRDLLIARSRREGLQVIFAGATPSADLIGSGPEVRRIEPRRLWPLVEVVDRREDPPGSGLLSDPAKQAIKAVSENGSVFVYAHRRGYSAASRCSRCRTLRVCTGCGSRPDPGAMCTRCGAVIGSCVECGADRFDPLGAGVGRLIEEIGRVVDQRQVGGMDDRRPIMVGTERDLARISACDLAVLVDGDGLVRGTNYRAAEEALRIGARVAAIVSGRGRMLLQTNDPDHHAIVALRRADPVGFFEIELEMRRALGYPPTGELMVIEARNLDDTELAQASLVSIAGRCTVLGPAETNRGVRWLIQGADLDRFKTDLRPVVDRWRNADVTVRIDVDPLDL